MISCFQSATTLLYSAKFPDVKHFSTTERRTYLTPLNPPPQKKIKVELSPLTQNPLHLLLVQILKKWTQNKTPSALLIVFHA